MPNLTTNLQLKKPLVNENYDINAHNYNSDIIDTEIQELKDTVGSGLIATNISIEDTGNVFTATDVEGALLEAINKADSAFQSANNGKTTIATAIGSPVLGTDTFSAMGTKIDTLTLTFRNNLISKGVTVLETDKMSNLVDKVSLLEPYLESPLYVLQDGIFNNEYIDNIIIPPNITNLSGGSNRGSVSQQVGCLRFSYGASKGDGSPSMMVSNRQIEIHKYSKLKFEIDTYNLKNSGFGLNFGLGLSDTDNLFYITTSCPGDTNSTKRIIEVPLGGNMIAGILKIYTYYYSAFDSNNGYTNIYNIWLEK